MQKALIAMRQRLNLTQAALASALRVRVQSVSRWERSRSPTGDSLMQLAAFARQTGQDEAAKVFLAAGLSLPLEMEDVLNWAAGAGLLFSGVAESAIDLIRAGRTNSAIEREYLNVLRVVLAALQTCVDEAIQAHRRGEDFLSIPDLLQAERDLNKEIAHEENKRKEREHEKEEHAKTETKTKG